MAVEAGVRLWAGVAPTGGRLPSTGELVDAVRVPWQQVGLAAAGLADVVLTPACGLAGRDAAGARAVLARLVEAAGALAEVAAG